MSQTGKTKNAQTGTPHSFPPNVVIIFTDDMGYADPACFGGTAPTPNIDRLGEGIKLTDFHVAQLFVRHPEQHCSLVAIPIGLIQGIKSESDTWSD